MKKHNTFEHDGDEYYDINKKYTRGPIITACPRIKWEPARQYWGKSSISSRKHVRVKKTPKFARFWKIINWPYYKWGGPQVSIVGNYGTGKSILLNLFTAFFIAKKLRVIMFNDRRFEARNLAKHGWFDKKGRFHPFIIDCFIPKDYEFELANPLWEHRNNVNRLEWSNVEDILANTKQTGHLTVVYDECFDEKGKMKLWIDLMTILGRTIEPKINYVFTHHELSSLIPEIPTRDIIKLVRQASNIALNLRKDRIGLMTTFHMQSEVFYRISQKFGFIIQKRPVNRKNMSDVERDARKYKLSECGISIAGYWTKHTIGYYPEVIDAYRLIPNYDLITYPSLKVAKKQDEKDEVELDPIDFAICQLRARGETWDDIAVKVGMSKGGTIGRGKRLDILRGKSLSGRSV